MHFEPYPFERLQTLLADITPNAPIRKLTIGEPQLPTPLSITTALQDYAKELRYYPPSAGMPYLKDAMLGFIKSRYGITLSHDQIIPTFGTREVLFNLPQFYLAHIKSPVIAHPNPFYQIYEGAAIASSATTIYMPLTQDNSFKPHLSDEQCKRVNLVILNSPNNPTGSTLSLEELVEWVQKALKYDFLLVCDECYSEIYELPDSLESTFLHSNAPAGILQASLAAGNANFKNILALNSISKRSSAPGLRSGFVAGDREILQGYMTYRTYAGLAQPMPLARASAVAWSDEESALEIRKIYSQNLKLARQLFPHIPIEPYSFYIWLPVGDDLAFTQELYKHTGIAVLPGRFLGRDNAGQGFVRIALVYPAEQMQEILEDLAKFYYASSRDSACGLKSTNEQPTLKTPTESVFDSQAAGGRIFDEKAGLCSLLRGDKTDGLSHKQKANFSLFRKKPTPKTRIHFIGIGGIGISGLAKYLRAQGAIISGSDIAHSPTTHYLRSLGVQIHIPHDKDAIQDQDLVIHSAIIKHDNPEIIQAKASNIPVLSREQALKLILDSKRVFSVCGAHGKSSISAMLSSILPDFGAIIGAESKEFHSNVREAQSECIIFEADESDKSFLNSNPYLAIIPNAEPEHMETYNHNIQELHTAYTQFLSKASLRCINDSDEFLRSTSVPSLHLNPAKDITDIDYFLEDSMPYTRFFLRNVGEFAVWGLGEHTAQNAALAILAALEFKKADSRAMQETKTLDDICYSASHIQQVRENLKHFAGIKKRFDILCTSPLTIIDDYAHHPTEIKATIQALRIYAKLRGITSITAIWQPHKYSRLFDNLSAFQECFDDLLSMGGKLVILPVWRAGEEKRELDLGQLFAHCNPLLATRTQRNANTLEIYHNDTLLATLAQGIAIGFGAGDITYQLRGAK
ncbi:UDP-N-acetylmuramate--L-alanine ligase [Helicobacter canis]|uniref:UDP-N-acetylmuramate--L-alanine ligase n=1 Tax=Helicobacter canis TaxID=29419 RepID=A0A377J5T8_9HELI|nr:UDP-N-acetylmuramate--L-alanine ligase [Helicobacter canis]